MIDAQHGSYKGKPVDAKVIGRESGVRYVPEGSENPAAIRWKGQRPTHDAESGAHQWLNSSDNTPAPIS